MSQKLVNHNDDLRRLVEKGYAVGFDSNYLIVRDILYLDEKLQQQVGAIVTKLVETKPDHVVQEDHQIFFAGSHPYNTDGTPIANLGGGETKLALSDAAADVVVQRQFSNKPRVNGQLAPFVDFFAKIESYVCIISGPAIARHGGTVLTFRTVEAAAEDSVFKIRDTLTSRAEITDLSAKFKDEVVAIIGLGGTGVYVLDFIIKTPVKEVRGFDGDPYQIHNAFRSPGRFEEAEFNQPKADVYQSRYENFRHGLKLHAKYIDASCAEDFDGVTFAFVCVDKGSARAIIIDLLIALKIPFIDVGMGLKRKADGLSGMVRTTYFPEDKAEQVKASGRVPLSDQPDDVYRTNIQIGELNALNAALAVHRYKQIKGFYLNDDPDCFNSLFGVNDCRLTFSRPGSDED